MSTKSSENEEVKTYPKQRVVWLGYPDPEVSVQQYLDEGYVIKQISAAGHPGQGRIGVIGLLELKHKPKVNKNKTK